MDGVAVGGDGEREDLRIASTADFRPAFLAIGEESDPLLDDQTLELGFVRTESSHLGVMVLVADMSLP